MTDELIKDRDGKRWGEKEEVLDREEERNGGRER